MPLDKEKKPLDKKKIKFMNQYENMIDLWTAIVYNNKSLKKKGIYNQYKRNRMRDLLWQPSDNYWKMRYFMYEIVHLLNGKKIQKNLNIYADFIKLVQREQLEYPDKELPVFIKTWINEKEFEKIAAFLNHERKALDSRFISNWSGVKNYPLYDLTMKALTPEQEVEVKEKMKSKWEKRYETAKKFVANLVRRQEGLKF